MADNVRKDSPGTYSTTLRHFRTKPWAGEASMCQDTETALQTGWASAAFTPPVLRGYSMQPRAAPSRHKTSAGTRTVLVPAPAPRASATAF